MLAIRTWEEGWLAMRYFINRPILFQYSEQRVSSIARSLFWIFASVEDSLKAKCRVLLVVHERQLLMFFSAVFLQWLIITHAGYRQLGS